MEEESKTIPHQIGGVHTDVLRFGLPGVKSDIVGAHPLESSLQSVISLFHFHVLSLSDLIVVFFSSICLILMLAISRVLNLVKKKLGF